jgi:hypothetical protein
MDGGSRFSVLFRRNMIDFQYIRKKQKGLFFVIAALVVFSFVILFTPNAEEIVFGQGRQSETGVYGQLDGETVTRDQWIEARNIVASQLGPQSRGIPESFLDTRAVQVLGEKALMMRYGIDPSKSDSDGWITNQVDKSIEGLPSESRPTRREALDNWAQGLGASASRKINEQIKEGGRRLEAIARYQVGVGQLRGLAGVAGILVSDKEAQIKFRNENEKYEAEAIFLSHTNYLPLVQSTDEQVKKHYTNTLARHRISERRQISYVTFPATNYLDEAEKKFNELNAAGRMGFLTNYWTNITIIAGYKTNTIPALAKLIAPARTNLYSGMKEEEATAAIREAILRTPHLVYENERLVELKSGLAVVEAYKAGLKFKNSLEETYKAEPALDTLENEALDFTDLTATTSPLITFEGNVPQELRGVTSADVFALSKTNALIISSAPFGSGDFFIASLKKVIPSRNQTFVEAKTTVTADFKKAESIKLMNEAGEKIHQSIKNGKALEEVGKENNLAVTKLGPFDSVGGAIPGLANKANREDVRTQALGLDVGAISELITSSTDSSDLASEEAAFVVKLTGKNAVSKDRFDAEFAGYLKSVRSAAASQSYFTWLRDETEELFKYSLKTYVDGEGEIDVKSDDGDGGFYKQGTTVTLVAKPAANFVFKEWSGAVTINTGSATNKVTVSSNSNVTATFVKKDAK